MKILLAFIFSFSLYTFANDFNGDKNMEIGLNPGKTTEASFNDPSKAHQSSQKSFGNTDVANCPNCGKQNALFEDADDGDSIIEGATGSAQDAQQDPKKGQQ